ncbi:YadA-like family protein, partial [Bradyrhizobium sp. NAS96.2]|uniref:YadA-like family protein n=1 Tax=Bradyrhizobium sp. NAS96.2 TaxID=1680160 RepID=UPI000961521F
ALGAGASATAASGSAFGNGAVASDLNATASGAGSKATAAAATAYGQGSTASAASATALGAGASASFSNSTAIGAGAAATAANQVAIGTASNTYRMAGVASAASLAAQSGPVSFVTSDAAGNLATSSFNPANITSLQSQFTSLQSQVMDNRFEARSGTAVALAAGSMPALQPGRKFALSAGYGNFEGANAFAIGATALLYDSKNYAIIANAGGGIGLERSVAGGRGAVSIQW